jgi:hypothetical protein
LKVDEMDTLTLIEIIGGVVAIAVVLFGIGVSYANLKNRLKKLEDNPMIKAYQQISEQDAIAAWNDFLARSRYERSPRRNTRRGR